ncbi:N-acyl-D-amino-acid deacylase family protein [Sphingomonas sp.]|uniref:N-acyl-D-amino-acid deacylase family protein n=1 Tax=Sphingomonas sp. TaxID=28214 RepID=UPI002DD678B9|nr:amidohydrolase family protein [Sphingomonas sp.]
MLDLAIKGGAVLDGSGSDAFTADIGIADGRIVEIGKVTTPARRTIDADGATVTPGFVDLHSHYDGQLTWGERMSPSSDHGVTTVVTGNCGVGFAPCRPQDRARLINLMEGVEDIPELVLSEGLPWAWETFGEFADFVGARRFDVDVGLQLPHSALRVYVMGERGAAREPATDDELSAMQGIAADAMRLGALGFATSNTLFHRTADGAPVPTQGAAERELIAIAGGLRQAGHGVIEMLIDLYAGDIDENVARLARIERASGHGLSFTLAQAGPSSDSWRRALAGIEAANAAGARVCGQVIGRPIGILIGHALSYNCFFGCPSYAPLRDLPLHARIATLRTPEVRAALLAESPEASNQPIHAFARRFEQIFRVSRMIDYEPRADRSVAALAVERGVSPLEMAYDLLLEDDGHAILYAVIGNYMDGNLDYALELMQHPNTILGLGDGGAHYGLICDASYSTHMLTYWSRDRAAGRIPLAEVVRKLTSQPAEMVGLNDRGRIALGRKADLNVLDHARMTLYAPRVTHDLPARGKRLVQPVDGYLATIVDGAATYRHGVATGELPGRLIRGPQALRQ